MSKRDEIEDDDDYDYEDEASGTPRVIALGITALVVVSFVGLSWYAYNASTSASNVSLEELAVIEADNSPVKEVPADPGGMKFPHQDKSIFDAITGNAPPSQEQLAAAPEEPLAKDGSQTAATTAPVAPTPSTGWVNERLAQEQAAAAAPAAPENAASVFAPPATTNTPPATNAPVVAVTPEAMNGLAPASTQPAEKLPPALETQKVEQVLPETKPVTLTKEPVKKTAAKQASAALNGTVQLGAYKSEGEATAAWKKLSKKYSSLAGGKMSVQRADLGAKGVFYRLRSQVADAKGTCQKLSAAGQACIVVK